MLELPCSVAPSAPDAAALVIANPCTSAPVVLLSVSGVALLAAVLAVFVAVAFQSPHVTPPSSRSEPLSVAASSSPAPVLHT